MNETPNPTGTTGATEAAKLIRTEEELRAASTLLDDPTTPVSLSGVHVHRAFLLLLEVLTPGPSAERFEPQKRLEQEKRLHLDGNKARTMSLFESVSVSMDDPTAAGPSKKEIRWAIRELHRVLGNVGETSTGAMHLRRNRSLTWLKFAGYACLALIILWEIRGRPDMGKGRWHALYYPTRNFSGEPTQKRDDDIAFDWSKTRPSFGLRRDTFSARWNSCLVLEKKRTIAFQTTSTSGVRLFVDGQKLIDNWKNKKLSANAKEMKLAPGVHHIRMEYKQRKKADKVHLRASISGAKPQRIPEKMLRYPGDSMADVSPCAHLAPDSKPDQKAE